MTIDEVLLLDKSVQNEITLHKGDVRNENDALLETKTPDVHVLEIVCIHFMF
jgi:hypothetical protein